ncbi:MAG: uracil phosphoribosyltransferase [Candidatus Muiribacterium halophilum]|uniref:Uracil phosphoribosyltransferase n=1 Tax=Muiribacterium halophilum TaxID=2053465 RepID=A0A2N5ZEC1_MUIH1|nr:MAG: uracil phosphoribosyltransferase [Candidatus Muirbacterium halophilum]
MITVVDHSLIKHKLAYVRDKKTTNKDFRELISEIALLLTYEATRKLSTVKKTVETPIMEAECEVVKGRKPVIVPILRAGLGMVDGILKVMPMAKTGHIGLYRDPVTYQPVEYFCKMPDSLEERQIFLVDPMLATGVSASAAIDILKKHNAQKIKFLCILSCPEGAAYLEEKHPDVDIFTAAMDIKLNNKKYILPGLGDAGDRIFVTI